ncbi:methyltransferase [Amycolatopsis vancoresmycina DSM 44592]|uniref:Methyltransferase n=1 Tax=Amycolatopsis vancoresmycina DSM 44592 TaxID=1292037 RepID=R1IGE1_9PSEU|nr:methyltransferase [Amycolatopsis vancoresmycina DSM 44592]
MVTGSAEHLALEKVDVVVSGLPWTAMTAARQQRILDAVTAARLTAVEINPRFAASLSERFPQVDVVTGSAEHLALEKVDVVVSGLPWTAMTAARQQRILDAVTAALAPNGRFTTFAYAHAAWTPPARRFAASLRSRFAVVERTSVVWGNLPPAFVYRAALPVAVGRTRRGQPAAASA